MRTRRSSTVIFFCAVLLLFLEGSSTASLYRYGRSGRDRTLQKTAPKVSIVRPEATSFQDNLKAISEQANVGFVAEGEPLKAVFTQDAIVRLQEGVPLSEAVSIVANGFDYSVEQRDNLFVLRKRFSLPEDLPVITLQEALLSLRNIVRLSSPYNPKFTEMTNKAYPPAAYMMSSLTPQQMRSLAAGIPVSSFGPQQRAEVWRIARYFYVQHPIQEVEATYQDLKTINQQDPVFCWTERNELRVFGYETFQGPKSEPFHASLSHWGQFYSGRGRIMYSYPTTNGKRVVPPDPTEPFAPKSGQASSEVPVAATLAQLAVGLNQRSDAKETMAVEEGLATKTAIVVGDNHATPNQVLRALAAVYGLRVLTRKEGELLLTWPRGVAAGNIRVLKSALLQSFPDPMRRAFSARLPDPKSEALPLPPDYRSVSLLLRNAAIKRFRTLVEPKVKASKEGRVALSELSDEERNVFAVVILSGCAGALASFADQPVPDYITNFNDVVVTGGLSPGKEGDEKFNLFLSQRTPEGNLNRGVGFGNVDYKP